jgi:hypothetical protein
MACPTVKAIGVDTTPLADIRLPSIVPVPLCKSIETTEKPYVSSIVSVPTVTLPVHILFVSTLIFAEI